MTSVEMTRSELSSVVSVTVPGMNAISQRAMKNPCSVLALKERAAQPASTLM